MTCIWDLPYLTRTIVFIDRKKQKSATDAKRRAYGFLHLSWKHRPSATDRSINTKREEVLILLKILDIINSLEEFKYGKRSDLYINTDIYIYTISFFGSKATKVTLAEDGATSSTESLHKGRKNFVHLLRT